MEVEGYKKARKVSDEVMEFAKSLVEEGKRLFEIAQLIEGRIRELGAEPAFPVNLSLNEHAAHYTPDIDDPLVLRHGDLLKVDIGVQVNGYIWDRAFSVCIGSKGHPLIQASESALKNALRTMKAGTKVCEVSDVVERTLKELGFNPVRNLCGHGLERWDQHAPPSIPNGRNKIQTELKAGQVIAMEVFATNGAGWVKESRPILIFKYVEDKPVRLPEAREILRRAKTSYHGLPFARRWLRDISPLKLDLALRQLVEVGALREYPILQEIEGGLVAQSEETVMVT